MSFSLILLKNLIQSPVVISVSLLFLAGILRYLKAKRNAPKPEGRLRSLSFSSEVLVDGAFPPDYNAPQAVVNALFHLEKCPEVEKLHNQIRRMIVFDRFRATARREGVHWQLYDLGIDNEVEKRAVETREVDGEEEIRAMADKLCMEEIPYDTERPLWRVYRLVNKGTGKSAMLFRVHHVIGDGIAMVGMMTNLFDLLNGEPFKLDIPEKIGGGSKMGGGSIFGIIFTFLKSLVDVLSVASSRHDTDIAFAPGHSPQYFKNKSNVRKTMYLPVVKLDFIKELKNKANVTINDVLMAATSGMLRRYSLLKKDGNVVNLSLKTNIQTRALLPVAFPRPKEDLQNKTKAMRNLFSMISLPMAVNETNAKDRLMECVRITSAAKSSPTAILQLFVQNQVLSLAPQFIAQQAAYDAFSRHSIVFSNVPGPGEHIALCGEKISSINVIFPNLIPQVIIMSYAGAIHSTLSADPTEIDDKVLPELYLQEIRELADAYGVNHDDMLAIV
jgi:NRPS condensation-like uncharacterized protein